jgi:WD40 repeat protein
MRHVAATLLLLALFGPLAAQPNEPPPKDSPDAPPDQRVPETPEDLLGKVFLGLNTGAHVAPIKVMRFTPDGHKLLTAQGGEVRVWDVATGHPEQVWRLPSGIVCLTISADGHTAAATGSAQLQADGKTRNAPIWLLALKKTGLAHGAGGDRPPPAPVPEVIRWPGPDAGITQTVTALAISPDGTRLAWGAGYQAHVYDLKAKVVTHTLQPAAARRGSVVRLAFGKDGNRLLVGLNGAGAPACLVWDVRPPASPGPKAAVPAAPLFTLGNTDDPWAAWSADNKHFAVLHPGSAFDAARHNVSLFAADGKLQRDFDRKSIDAELSGGEGRW